MDSEKLGELTKENFAVLFPNQNVDALQLTLTFLDVANAEA